MLLCLNRTRLCMADMSEPLPSAPSFDATEQNPPLGVDGILSSKAGWIHYGRVILDVVMVIFLIAVVATDTGVTANRPGKTLHVHEMPIYLKEHVPFGKMWKDAEDKTKNATSLEKLANFKGIVNSSCVEIPTHPMCVCVMGAPTQLIAKNCLLQNPTPSINVDWNIGTVSSAMILWFLASLATSIGTLPYIDTYMNFEPSSESPTVAKQTAVVSYHKFVVGAYIILTVSALVVPIIITEAQFHNQGKHMDSLFNMQMWSLIAIGTLGIYNWETVVRYVGYGQFKGQGDGVKVDVALHFMSVTNWITYVHLLVSAPAIAMVLHLTQCWTEYNTVVNTTLILSAIFSVDAFSAEMANYWSYRATKKNLETSHPKQEREILNMHTRLGLIRMFGWMINLVMIFLLFSLAYPIVNPNPYTLKLAPKS